MNIVRGIVKKAQKVILYGPEGIGKSTFASQFPNPVFIDTEGSTNLLDVARMPAPTSWTILLDQVKWVRDHPKEFRTLVLDTADWAEMLCISAICDKFQKTGIEDFGYGKGYVFLGEEFGKMLNLLQEVVDRGVNVVVTAHAKMRKFDQPDEMGAYDRWEMKLNRTTAPLLKEWGDMVLFANYKTSTIKTKDGKVKADGGQRVIYTAHHPCWDGKNRHGLPNCLPLDYKEIAHCFDSVDTTVTTPSKKKVSRVESTGTAIKEPSAESVAPQEPVPAVPKEVPPPSTPEPEQKPQKDPPVSEGESIGHPSVPDTPPQPSPGTELEHLLPLTDLMEQHDVSFGAIRRAVASRGYFPADMEVWDYPPDFVKGVLVGAWEQVHQLIIAQQAEETELPFTVGGE